MNPARKMQPTPTYQIFGVFIILSCIAIYWSGLAGPFLFDDQAAITGNSSVQIAGDSPDQWRVAAFSSASGPLRRPIAMLSFAVNHVVTGDFAPFGLKVVNLSIHIAIAIVLYFLFLSVLQTLQITDDHRTKHLLAVVGAAIWLLHPLNVSTVLYTVQRMAQLASFFVVSGLLVFMRYRQRWARQGASQGEILTACLWLILLTAFAALSKENGALLPWLILVLEVCIFRGVWANRANRYLASAGWLALLSPLLLVTALFFFNPENLTAGYAGREFTLEERLLTQGRLLWRYLGWIIVPNVYDMGFQHDDIPVSTGLFSPVITLWSLISWPLLLLVSLLLRRRYPLLLLGVLFFLIGHSMESSVLPLEMVYEHRNYLPSTIVCLVMAAALILPVLSSKKIGVGYPVFGVLAILCMLLLIRVQTWSDELTLSRVNLAQHPDSSRSNFFYANALLRQYRRAEQEGISERDRLEGLLLSRHHFEQMYKTNDRDVAALVMLYYLDGRFFTQLQEHVDWLAKLEELLDSRILQASDWNALATLFDILSAENSVVEHNRVMGILDKLSMRFPTSAAVPRFRYRYLASQGVTRVQLLAALYEAQELAPGTAWVYSLLLHEYAGAGDLASMYETARLWMLEDVNRYSILQIKGMFTSVQDPSSVEHD